MVRITAPLLSQSASGTIAGRLTFETRNGRAYVYDKKRGKGYTLNGHTAGYGRNKYGSSYYGYTGKTTTQGGQKQGAQRVIFLSGWAAWALLSDEEKMILSDEARPLQITGANLFLKRYMDAHTL